MYERPGRGIDLTADKLLTHNTPHYQGGYAGVPIKQDNPKTLDSLASRTQIQTGVKYFLRIKRVCEVPDTTLAGATVGAPVYIVKTTDALTLTAGATGLNAVLGRVQSLAGQYGTPTGILRVNMDARDSVTIP
jgi:hypothetical protein